MNINYSDHIIELFSAPSHVSGEQIHVPLPMAEGVTEIHLLGCAGDLKIGEYVQITLQVQKTAEYINSIIYRATFSAIGSVLLIAAAEKLCSLVEGKSFQSALQYCDPETGLTHLLSAPIEKIYSINFVIQAFYKTIETLTVS